MKKGQKQTEEAKEKIRQARLGKKHSTFVKHKMSLSQQERRKREKDEKDFAKKFLDGVTF